MKVILVEEGMRSELNFPRPVVAVGRSADNDIRLSDEKVSRHHCRIEGGPEGVWVVDLGSSNGTLVNGQRITRCLLEPSDQLAVGRATIQIVHAVEESARDAAATVAISRDSIAADTREVGTTTLTGETERERENLRVFARITRELVRETDLAPLLRQIVDSAVALVGAERGFLLLMETRRAQDRSTDMGSSESAAGQPPAETMKVRVARSFDREDVPLPSSRISMGIARAVAHSRKAVLSVDAGHDERFRGMASVEDLRLRSVMCLPIQSEDGVEGVLYVDNRLQRAAFTEDDLDLIRLFADQASIAIRNARMLSELRERNNKLAQSARQIELLNEQLGRKVRDRDQELSAVRAELERERGRYDYASIIGTSDEMRKVFRQLDRIIESELSVLIEGESGTGKELIARAIHYNGLRKDKPFVTENCAALPDTLLESELFGHTRGAFTGAHRAKKGLLEQADGGTLFLDEIGDMSVEMQKKLLRVLQEGEIRILGSNQRVRINVRVIAASHQNLEELVREGRFREDLFYRVNVLRVELPPLRARREDIPLLAESLLARAAREAGRPVPALQRDVLAALVAHDWPGNVRELENEMRRLVVLAGEIVGPDLLSTSVLERRSISPVRSDTVPHALSPGENIRDAVADLERRAIESALREQGGNKSRAASALGISRFALQRKLDKYRMSTPRSAEHGEESVAAAAEPAQDASSPESNGESLPS